MIPKVDDIGGGGWVGILLKIMDYISCFYVRFLFGL